MKRRLPLRLSIHRETLRRLDDRSLAAARPHGGNSMARETQCAALTTTSTSTTGPNSVAPLTLDDCPSA